MQYQALPWGLMYAILTLFHTVQYSSAVVSKGNLPREIQDCYNSYAQYSLREVVGHSICWACEAPAIPRLHTEPPPFESPVATRYIHNLMEKVKNEMHGNRVKRQARPRCIRKEYRRLTYWERTAFHNALNVLKGDTSVPPNRYDVLARLHNITIASRAHGGPAFLPWHRFYLRLLEIELQSVDPSICMPYWDSSIENRLTDPSTSYLFSEFFMGTNDESGLVTTGPFAGWTSQRHGPLTRNVGRTGQLFSEAAINRILSQNFTRDITPPNAHPDNSLEGNHNFVHVFIGGLMNFLDSAAFDPFFFLHHCFVDYLWERLRDRQRAAGIIDPQIDYPQDFGSPLHAPNLLMGFPNMDITALEGFNNSQAATFEYEPSPTRCSWFNIYCGSRFLWCNVRRRRCIPLTRPTRQFTRPTGRFTGIRKKRAVVQPPTNPRRLTDNMTTPAEPIAESSPKLQTEIQNSFCIDGTCDTREWVYLTFKVIAMRSSDVTLKSYPVYNGSIWKGKDIYQPSSSTEQSQYLSKGHPKCYNKCNNGTGIGQIFIHSQGLNYGGAYKEAVTIDRRLTVSLAVGYLAVKDPKNGPVKVLLRAADSCGRICKPAFKTPGTTRYELFSGVLDITDVPGLPKQYSKTCGQAMLDTWVYSNNSDIPNLNDDGIFLTFYCDYSDVFPWIDETSTLPRHRNINQKSRNRQHPQQGPNHHSSVAAVDLNHHSLQPDIGPNHHSLQPDIGPNHHSWQPDVGPNHHSFQPDVGPNHHSLQPDVGPNHHSLQPDAGPNHHSWRPDVGPNHHSSEPVGGPNHHSLQPDVAPNHHSLQPDVAPNHHSWRQDVGPNHHSSEPVGGSNHHSLQPDVGPNHHSSELAGGSNHHNLEPAIGQNECQVDADCIIKAPCIITLREEFCQGQKYACQGTCNKYVQCREGKIHKGICPNNWAFDSYLDGCTSSRLCHNRHTGRSGVLRHSLKYQRI